MENVTNLKKSFSEINKNWGTQISLAMALIILMIIFSISSRYFFTLSNFVNLGHYMSILGIMAAGCTVALIVGALDVSQTGTAKGSWLGWQE